MVEGPYFFIRSNPLQGQKCKGAEYLAVSQARKAIFLPTSGLTEGILDSLGFSAAGR